MSGDPGTGTAAPLTNGAYGFPTRAHERRVAPVALACIHITGNAHGAADPDLHRAALAERTYANRAGSPGPSAHDYDARDGWTVRAIDPLRFAAWSNGAIRSPDTSNAGVRRVMALVAKGYNANEAYWLATEEVGATGAGYPITDAQRASVAIRIAAIAQSVNMRATVDTIHAHGQLDSVNRSNCPVPRAARSAFLADIIARVNALLEGGVLFDLTGQGNVLRGKATLIRDAAIVRVDNGATFPLHKGDTRNVYARVTRTSDKRPGYLVTQDDIPCILFESDATLEGFEIDPNDLRVLRKGS